ncbi:MAG: DNA glycosylase [Bacillota bacterium]|nr:DNA glycosylase [Bacillota bacterium]
MTESGYRIKEDNGILTIEGIRDFDTDHIFDCGQCFRWERKDDGSYIGMAYGRNVEVSFSEDTLTITNCTLDDYNSIWKKYFDFERDYGEIKRVLATGDSVMNRAIEYGRGIRILNQEKWETLISFIISQNNNIPRIKGCIESLCRNFGEYVGNCDGREWYSFPSAHVLAELTEEDLAPCRLGYRARYLLETGKQVAAAGEGSLEKLASEDLTADDTIEQLRKFTGVGPKVASCIALFAMGRMESFPIDVWVKRVMNRLYGIPENDVKAMNKYATEHFGKYGGIAQQYLFYYITHAGCD